MIRLFWKLHGRLSFTLAKFLGKKIISVEYDCAVVAYKWRNCFYIDQIVFSQGKDFLATTAQNHVLKRGDILKIMGH